MSKARSLIVGMTFELAVNFFVVVAGVFLFFFYPHVPLKDKELL